MAERRSAHDRFWAKVEKTERCWLWRGARDRYGYGLFAVSNTPRRDARAHRWAYAERFGPIESSTHLLHSCDNPPCVNPDHLRPGTQADNMADMAAKGRANRRPVVSNETHPNHRLTNAQVAEIRSRYSGRWGEQRQLAAEYGVTPANICKILKGRGRRLEAS